MSTKLTTETQSSINNDSSKSDFSSKKRHMKDSASQVISIAQTHYLDAMVSTETPTKTLFERAMFREKQRKEHRQKNLEQIIKATLDACNKEVAGEPDFDWLTRYFEMAQEIHNTSMQKLWAQVLKREITNPGSTSLKALKTLKDMTPKEAQTLQRAASLACTFGTDSSRKLLLGVRHHAGFFSFSKRESIEELSLGEFQLPYSSLLLLMELGILLTTELESGEIEASSPLKLVYQGNEIALHAKSKGISLTYYRFTPTGNELCHLLGNRSNSHYQSKLIDLLNRKFIVKGDASNPIHHTV